MTLVDFNTLNPKLHNPCVLSHPSSIHNPSVLSHPRGIHKPCVLSHLAVYTNRVLSHLAVYIPYYTLMPLFFRALVYIFTSSYPFVFLTLYNLHSIKIFTSSYLFVFLTLYNLYPIKKINKINFTIVIFFLAHANQTFSKKSIYVSDHSLAPRTKCSPPTPSTLPLISGGPQ